MGEGRSPWDVLHGVRQEEEIARVLQRHVPAALTCMHLQSALQGQAGRPAPN